MAETKTALATPLSEPASGKPGGKKGSWLLKILLGVAAIVVLLVAVVAMQPTDFTISRSATIAAPPAAVFDQVNDLHNWEAWSPWAKLDPNAKNTFEGPPAGEGAVFKWSGNDQIGEGKMTITESRPNELVRFKLEFVRPMEDTSTSEFTFQPSDKGTVVNWSMSGQKNFICKGLCTFGILDMDKMLGGEFEKGLATMKSVVEAKPAESNGSADDAASNSET